MGKESNKILKILSKHRLLSTYQVWELYDKDTSIEDIENHLWELVKRNKVETIEYRTGPIRWKREGQRLWGLPGRLPRLSDISEYIQTSISKEEVN